MIHPWTMMVVMLVTLAGCMATAPQTPTTQKFPHEALVTTLTDTALPSRQPIDSAAVNHLTIYQGKPGQALVAGTVLKRLPDNDPRAVQSAATGKVDPQTHPWIPVEVVASLHAPQKGWFGWVHTSALTPSPNAQSPTGTLLGAGLKAERLADKAWLCQWPHGDPEPGPKCEFPLHPSLPLKVHGCQNGYAQVSLWDPEGVFVSGFVRASAFKTSPCGR